MHTTLGEKCYECYMAQETADFFRALHDFTTHIDSMPLFGLLLKSGVGMTFTPNIWEGLGKEEFNEGT